MFAFQDFQRTPLALAVTVAVLVSACGGSNSEPTTTSAASAASSSAASSASSSAASSSLTASAPVGLGVTDVAPVQNETTVKPFVDFIFTNQRGDARYATKDTNAGVRLLAGFLEIWQPTSLIVDAGVTAAAVDTFPAVVASTWSGVPGVAPDGVVLNSVVHNANINYVADVTSKRTTAQELQAYLDDRRQKGYSVVDGLGPLTAAWRAAAQQTTTITDMAADATTKSYSDTGNNVGVGEATNTEFGKVVDLVGNIGTDGSTEPAKRFFKYARPWRWTTSVIVAPSLVPVKSTTPVTDGGYTSGHTAEGVRDAFAMAYAVPERFQELLTRGLELGESRILGGMHSPLDVMSGRVLGTATAAASLVNSNSNAGRKDAAFAQARTVLMARAGVTTWQAYYDFAHATPVSADRFADYATNKTAYTRMLTYGFAPINSTTKAVTVPKKAEVLLETRLPYLTADQRRVVLKSTALQSGYPILDDEEGWGRMNYFAAADGYGRFDGDVSVTMDAALGNFNAVDSWKNAIAGAGKLTKAGSGVLKLVGANTWTGGVELQAGTLQGESVTAFGQGDVYVGGGVLAIVAPTTLNMSGRFAVASAGTLGLTLGSGTRGRLAVTGTTTLLGGTLRVDLANGYKPTVGETITIVTSGKLQGTFSKVELTGFNATVTYTDTGIQLRITA